MNRLQQGDEKGTRERERKKEEERKVRVKAVFPRSQIFKSEP